MKRLNRKGFTLIELLAVVIILAIIVVVTVPTIINTIEDARVQSIWNLAGSIANSYDDMVAQDLLTNSENDILKDGNVLPVGGEWTCINSHSDNDGTTLASIFDLSANDVNLDGDKVPTSAGVGGGLTVTQDTCSAIRIKDNGSAEVLLVAKPGGRFDINGRLVYGYSSEDYGHEETIGS